MKRTTWRKHHKWFGLLISFFVLMFCLSGIVLNHRTLVADVNVGRKWLPGNYRFRNWNNGLLRGTLRYVDEDSVSHVLLYGNSGIWQTDSQATSFAGFNSGLPEGIDFRNIKGLVQTPAGELFAAGQFGLYHYTARTGWKAVALPQEETEERLSDITGKGDTLVVVGRSNLYIASAPYTTFHRLEVKAPEGYDGKVSLFRTVWLIHSGELFGLAGKILMDGVAIALILLCVTGLLFWALPKRRKKARTRSLSWHNLIGRKTIILTLFVALTGWCLRPPVLIALAQGKVPAIPGTSLDDPNAWNDRLRMLRFDDRQGDWLLSTSEGFYALPALDAVPVKVKNAPPVSVMGLNVWQKDRDGRWLAGSFSGLFVWNRQQGRITDYYTGETPPEEAGPPFGKRAIAGYSGDFDHKVCIAEYYEGTSFAPMPDEFTALPISFWNLCLEIHSGRIYTFLGQGTLVFVFFAGAMVIWCLWSGRTSFNNCRKPVCVRPGCKAALDPGVKQR